MPKCDHLVPDSGDIGAHDELLECVLEKYHTNGGHLVKRADGRWIIWSRDYECECEDIDCECILWEFMSEREAQETIATYGVK